MKGYERRREEGTCLLACLSVCLCATFTLMDGSLQFRHAFHTYTHFAFLISDMQHLRHECHTYFYLLPAFLYFYLLYFLRSISQLIYSCMFSTLVSRCSVSSFMFPFTSCISHLPLISSQLLHVLHTYSQSASFILSTHLQSLTPHLHHTLYANVRH